MPTRVDWYYRDRSSPQCDQARAFLAARGLEPKTVVDGGKVRMSPDHILAQAREATELYVATGDDWQHIDLAKQPHGETELRQLVLGTGGAPRAPTVRCGTVWLIGFHPEPYERVFGPPLPSKG